MNVFSMTLYISLRCDHISRPDRYRAEAVKEENAVCWSVTIGIQLFVYIIHVMYIIFYITFLYFKKDNSLRISTALPGSNLFIWFVLL